MSTEPAEANQTKQKNSWRDQVRKLIRLYEDVSQLYMPACIDDWISFHISFVIIFVIVIYLSAVAIYLIDIRWLQRIMSDSDMAHP